MLTVVPDGWPGHDGRKDEVSPSLIDEIVREGARRMLAGAHFERGALAGRPGAAAA